MNPYIIVALVVSGSAIALDPCFVDCSKNMYEHLTADPVNCKNYYICFDDQFYNEYPFTCEGDMFFDIITNSCRDSHYVCTPECETCAFECSAPVLGKIASTVDCGIYYECDTGKLITCSSDKPFFDGNVCQMDENSCCTCKSYCTASDAASHKMVSDLYNCTNFYLCMEQGIPDHSTHGHCPNGNFDPQTRTCNLDVPCIQPCA